MSVLSNPTAAVSRSANATAADTATGYGAGSDLKDLKDLKVIKDLNDFKVFFCFLPRLFVSSPHNET